MGKISVQVWHAPDGEILAIGRPGPDRAEGIVPTVAGSHSVLETEVDEDYIGELARTHAVDVSLRRLIAQKEMKDRTL